MNFSSLSKNPTISSNTSRVAVRVKKDCKNDTTVVGTGGQEMLQPETYFSVTKNIKRKVVLNAQSDKYSNFSQHSPNFGQQDSFRPKLPIKVHRPSTPQPSTETQISKAPSHKIETSSPTSSSKTGIGMNKLLSAEDRLNQQLEKNRASFDAVENEKEKIDFGFPTTKIYNKKNSSQQNSQQQSNTDAQKAKAKKKLVESVLLGNPIFKNIAQTKASELKETLKTTPKTNYINQRSENPKSSQPLPSPTKLDFIPPQPSKNPSLDFYSYKRYLPNSLASHSNKNPNKKLIYKKNFEAQKAKFLSAVGVVASSLIFACLLALSANFFGFEGSPAPAVAGINELAQTSSRSKEDISFEKWSIKSVGKVISQEEDSDNDGLSNYQEFHLGTKPDTKYTCDSDNTKTDRENLIELVNPVTCKPLSIENEKDLVLLSSIVKNPSLQNQIVDLSDSGDKEEDSKIQEPDNNTDILNYFEVESYKDLDSLNINDFDPQTEPLKIEYFKKINKIAVYIQKNRSFEEYDKKYQTPSHPAVYLQVSLDYNTPLKYILAVGRLESRFGTDRFDMSGNPTRIHKYQNIFSMGLDDSGNNKSFDNWNDGVESFGRWYQYFEQKQVSDCQKWKIYNPNGDYCAKVEKLASQIQEYLNSSD